MTTADAIAQWGNLPLRERIVDALSEAMFHAFDVLQMIELDPRGHEFETVAGEVRGLYETINEIMGRIAD